MAKATQILSSFARGRFQGQAIEQVMAPLCESSAVSCFSREDRLSVWRRVWWYRRDPRMCLLLRDSGHWEDAQSAWETLSKEKGANLLSKDLMEISLPQARHLPVEHWNGRAIEAVSDLGLDSSTRFLWAAVHALSPSHDRFLRALIVPWPDPVERQAVHIVVNKWVVSGSAGLDPAMDVWRHWMSAQPRRMALFGTSQEARIAFERDRSFNDQQREGLDRLAAAMRRFMLETAAITSSSPGCTVAGPRKL